MQSFLRLGKDEHGMSTIYDPLRKKHIRATPEEIVRQLWIHYFLEEKKLNGRLIAIERMFKVDGLLRRFDLVIFNNKTEPILLAEFKGPEIKIGQLAFDQISRYNMQLNVPYALLSNGTFHYCFRIDNEAKKFEWLERLPFGENG